MSTIKIPLSILTNNDISHDRVAIYSNLLICMGMDGQSRVNRECIDLICSGNTKRKRKSTYDGYVCILNWLSDNSYISNFSLPNNKFSNDMLTIRINQNQDSKEPYAIVHLSEFEKLIELQSSMRISFSKILIVYSFLKLKVLKRKESLTPFSDYAETYYTSCSRMENDINIDKRQIRTIIKALKDAGLIDYESASIYSKKTKQQTTTTIFAISNKLDYLGNKVVGYSGKDEIKHHLNMTAI